MTRGEAITLILTGRAIYSPKVGWRIVLDVPDDDQAFLTDIARGLRDAGQVLPAWIEGL